MLGLVARAILLDERPLANAAVAPNVPEVLARWMLERDPLASTVRRIAHSTAGAAPAPSRGNAPASRRRPVQVVGSVTPPRQTLKVLGRSSSAVIFDRARNLALAGFSCR